MDQNSRHAKPQRPHSFGRKAGQSSLQWDFALKLRLVRSAQATSCVWYTNYEIFKSSKWVIHVVYPELDISVPTPSEWLWILKLLKGLSQLSRNVLRLGWCYAPFVESKKTQQSIPNQLHLSTARSIPSSTMPQRLPKNQSKKETCWRGSNPHMKQESMFKIIPQAWMRKIQICWFVSKKMHTVVKVDGAKKKKQIARVDGAARPLKRYFSLIFFETYWCCRNVHRHLPGKLSLLELRTSTMWESYLNCFAPCNSARSLLYVFTTPVLIASIVIVSMGEHHTGIHVHVRFHRLVESFPHVTPIILAAGIWFQTLRPGNVSQALISTKLAPHLSGEAW